MKSPADLQDFTSNNLGTIKRHKAAIRRQQYSLPVKCLIRDQLITASRMFFDYGCGYGDDLAGLQAEGIICDGFDPAFRPDAPKRASSVVNLGFVLNVIEDIDERAEILQDAWNLTEQVLCVAVRILVNDFGGATTEYGDGVLTRIGTFQKFYTQAELRQYLSETLGQECFPAAPGVYYLFRDTDLKSAYLASTYRQRIAAPRQHVAEVRYEEHRDLLDPLLNTITDFGRLPEPDEFALAEQVIAAFGSLERAFALIRRVTAEDDWKAVRQQRSEDLLVYLALANFGKRPKCSDLSPKLQRDVRAFFGSYKSACCEADKLMFRTGNPTEIDAACQQSSVGRLCPNSLWIHESARDQLAPLLRIYEGCARAFIGSVEGANLVKLHRFSGKVSYLACPDFESDPHPITTETTKVWLRTLQVGFYETLSRLNPPLLDQKERMLGVEDSRRARFERLTNQEFKHGLLTENTDFMPRGVWKDSLQRLRFEHRGHRLVRRTQVVGSKSITLPKRCSKYGVGKRMGGAVYVHQQYEYVLGDLLTAAKAHLPNGFEYTVIKHTESNGNFSFMHCPNFDSDEEPSIGDYVVVKSNGTMTLHAELADPYIYHHKWLFVAEDYARFSVEDSKKRSLAWLALSNIDKSRIGRKAYWKENVASLLQDPASSS